MKIKSKFAISNILMLIMPILSMGFISMLCVIIFILKFPVEEINLSRASLLNPSTFFHAVGVFLQNNPTTIYYIIFWLTLCIIIAAIITTVITQQLSLSVRKPIDDITKAALKIQSGELDFDVLGSDYDEINTLCTAFNDMRISLKESEKKTTLMNHERNMLLANISHDLKTPITSIKGYIEGIKDGVACTPEKLNKYLDTIKAKTEMIDEMVNNLSVYSKLELSRLEFNFRTGNLNEFLLEFLEDYRLDLEKNNMELTLNLCKKNTPVRLDYEKMSRVLSNIINNSIKYKDGDTGTLTIKTYIENNGVYTEISDTGIGLSEDDTKKVFEGFYRVDKARTLNTSGSGLGLGIAKQIIEYHKGKIWIKAKDKGITTFICLPLEDNK